MGKAAEDLKAARKLRKKIADTDDAQHINKAFQLTKEQRDGVAAIELLQNLREQDAEVLEERARRAKASRR